MRLASYLLCAAICATSAASARGGLDLVVDAPVPLTPFAFVVTAGQATPTVTLSIVSDGVFIGSNSLVEFQAALTIRDVDAINTPVAPTVVGFGPTIQFPTDDEPVFASFTPANPTVIALGNDRQFRGANAAGTNVTPNAVTNHNALRLNFQTGATALGNYQVYALRDIENTGFRTLPSTTFNNTFTNVQASVGPGLLLGTITVNAAPAAVPEPGSISLIGAALAVCGLYRWRASRRKPAAGLSTASASIT